MALMVGGAVAVAAVGYWYYSSSQTAAEEEGSNYEEDKIEQITFSGDADSVRKSDHSNSFDDRKTLEDEDTVPMTAAEDANLAADSISGTVDDVEAKDSMDTAPNEADPAKKEAAEPEDSPVIIEPTAQEVAAQRAKEEAERQRAEAQRAREREEKEREAARHREEERLQGLIRKYDAIADRVAKCQSFRYKNGKLRVKVLRATNVDKRDMGKKDFSDVYVKMEVPKAKAQKSTVKKDMENPVWNEEFHLNVRDALKDGLKLTVMDHDVASMDDTIGTVEVNVVDICASSESRIVGRAFDVKGSKKGCKLYVDLAYSEEAPKKK